MEKYSLESEKPFPNSDSINYELGQVGHIIYLCGTLFSQMGNWCNRVCFKDVVRIKVTVFGKAGTDLYLHKWYP